MARSLCISTIKSGSAKEYANAHDISISPAGVLTFYWQTGERHSGKPKAYKFTTSVPFTVEEDAAIGC